MDSTLIAALMGVVATLVSPIVAAMIINRIRKEKGTLRGTIDQLILPNEEAANIPLLFKRKLSTAKEIRMCGWSLYRVIDETRAEIRELTHHGCKIRILILDPEAEVVEALDSIITDTDPKERRSRNWPPTVSKGIAKHDLARSIEILRGNGVIKNGAESRDILHLCNTLLPFGLLMVESEDGSGWASVQIYPLHPDTSFEKRLTFILGNNKTELWRVLSEQFDFAWEDPKFSHPLNEK
jgi:hypothetical protein